MPPCGTRTVLCEEDSRCLGEPQARSPTSLPKCLHWNHQQGRLGTPSLTSNTVKNFQRTRSNEQLQGQQNGSVLNPQEVPRSAGGPRGRRVVKRAARPLGASVCLHLYKRAEQTVSRQSPGERRWSGQRGKFYFTNFCIAKKTNKKQASMYYFRNKKKIRQPSMGNDVARGATEHLCVPGSSPVH